MHTTAKRVIALCSMVVMLVLATSIIAMPALAASGGCYIADATPHYKHPITGDIEDSGGDNSSVLGQSMTETVTHKKALVEVDKNGNTYVTLRFRLMNSIENLQFQVDGKPITATCMQKHESTSAMENTADYRMQVNNEKSIIRCSMTVTAMGRDVIYYITVSDLQPGSGDFITSIETEPPTVPETKPESVPPVTEPPATRPDEGTVPPTAPPTEGTVPPTAPPTVPPTEPPTEAPDEKPTEAPSEPPATKPSEPENSKVPGLQEFDENGNPVEQSTPSMQNSGSHLGSFLGILAGLAVILVLGFAIWYFCFFKKK